jgi:hypothetical protein
MSNVWTKKQTELKRKYKTIHNWLLLGANVMLALITFLAVHFARKYYDNQDKHAKMDKTIDLLNLRESWYKDYTKYESDTQLNIALSWDGYIKDDDMMTSIWKESNKDERLELLVQNMAVRKIFAFFEKVKMLHKKDQIDLDYFFNEIFYSIVRMENIDTTKSPSVQDYLQKLRKHYKLNNDLFDGYYYCKDSIIDYEKTLKQSTIVLLAKKH